MNSTTSAGASLPVQLVMLTWKASLTELTGGVQKWRTDTENVWVAIVNAAHRNVDVGATLLAALIVDHAEQVLHPWLMPWEPGSGLLRDDGSWHLAKGRTFPLWAEREIERVAGVLRHEHRPFLEQVVEALHGRLTKGFRRPGPHSWIRDDDGSVVVVDAYPHVPVDLTQSDVAGKGLPWYAVARLDYRRDRFMRHLTDEQLERRLSDIVANTTAVTPAGLVSPGPLGEELIYWMARFSEVTEEIALRYGPRAMEEGRFRPSGLPGSLDPRNLGKPTRLATSRQSDGPVLVKYGSAKYLRPALERGEIRVAPASTYGDASLNVAIQADEYGAAIEYTAQLLPPLDGPRVAMPNRLRVRATQRVETNYYVFCTANVLDLRLLFDFGGDCCIVVRDPKEFSGRLLGAMKEKLPDWIARSSDVEYFDPLQVTPAQVRLPMAKHFRYAYQREHRHVWLPPDKRDTLHPIYLKLGSLTDIAELVAPVAG